MKIYEINMPKLFYLYSGSIEQVGRYFTAAYRCAKCNHTFRSLWTTKDQPFVGAIIDDDELYCPKCGSHFVTWRTKKDFAYLADGDYIPVSMKITLDEYQSHLKLTLKGDELVGDSESPYMFHQRQYKETISFESKSREVMYKRFVNGELVTIYLLGNPFDSTFFEDTNLKVLNHRLITAAYINDFKRLLRLLRNKLQKKVENHLKHKIKSMYVCHEQNGSYFIKPIFNIAYRLNFIDLPNISIAMFSRLGRGYSAYLNYQPEYYGMSNFDFSEEDMHILKKAKDSITGLIDIMGLPNKTLIRKFIMDKPFSVKLLREASKLADGNLDITKNIYEYLCYSVKSHSLYDDILADNLKNLILLKSLLGLKYVNTLMLYHLKLHDSTIFRDSLTMLSHLNLDYVNKLKQEKPSASKLHNWLAKNIYLQKHPFRKFDINDPIVRRLAMQLDNIKFYLPENSKVLYEVGSILKNCVGSYAEKVYLKKTNIVLMTDDTGKLKACIEVKDNCIKQAKLFGNKPAYTDLNIKLEIIKWANTLNLCYMNCLDISVSNSSQREAVG